MARLEMLFLIINGAVTKLAISCFACSDACLWNLAETHYLKIDVVDH